MRDDGERTSDGELLRRYAEHDAEDAFAEIVARYVDLVYSAALRQVGGDAHGARDVAQVVFATLARKARALASHPVLAGWLYTSTHLAAAKLRRTEARRLAREREACAMNAGSSEAEPAIDWERLRPVLDAAMGELRERDRTAVLLRFFAQRPFAEIGAALGVSEDGARMRVERALEKLRGRLARSGVTSTAAALGLALTNQAVAAAPAGLAAQLAGAALASGGAASVIGGVVYFMSTTKFVSAVAVAAVLLSVGVAVHEVRRGDAAREALAGAQREQAAAAARQSALQARVRAAGGAVAQASQALADARAAAAKAAEAQRAAARSTPDAAAEQLAAGNAFLAKFPAVKQALLERSYARIRARYQPWYAEAKLGPDSIAKFEELLLDYEGISTGSPQSGMLFLRPGAGRSPTEVEAALRELLGAENYAAYQDYTKWLEPRGFTQQLAEALYFTEEPLTPEQNRAMTQAVMAGNQHRTNGGDPRDWDVIFEKARAVLSPVQLAALERLRVQEDFQTAVRGLFTK